MAGLQVNIQIRGMSIALFMLRALYALWLIAPGIVGRQWHILIDHPETCRGGLVINAKLRPGPAPDPSHIEITFD